MELKEKNAKCEERTTKAKNDLKKMTDKFNVVEQEKLELSGNIDHLIQTRFEKNMKQSKLLEETNIQLKETIQEMT